MLISLLFALLAAQAQPPVRPVPRPAPRPVPARPAAAQPPAPTYFTTPLSLAEMRGKQAVLDTSAGSVVLTLLPETAPNQVGLFITRAREGAYNGTTFHRVIRYGIIQGGDPLSTDPGKSADYGSGGFNQIRAESRTEKHTAGAVSAVLLPNMPDSAGAQFFICASDQPGLDGQDTVFARVVDGLEVVQAISARDADADGHPRERIEIKTVTIRDTPVDPLVAATPADLAAYKATVETSMGSIEFEMLPDKAPQTVRAFLQFAAAGIYDGIKVHRVAPGFVIQTGALAFRQTPLTVRQQALVHNLPPEFTDTPNLPGIVSMARGDDPGSGSTSFFICIGECRALDGKYTVFARVANGMDIVRAIATVPVDGEAPRTEIVMRSITIEKREGQASGGAH